MLSERLRAELQLGRDDLIVEPDYPPNFVAAGFVGHACEYIERHQGGRSSVAPMSQIGRGALKSWLGFHEMWEQKSGNVYTFHHVSLTVHLGYIGELNKPQIFRSEWPGIRNWTSAGVSFQAHGAGHPHWQIDAVRTIREAETTQRERSLAFLLEQPVAKEFEPSSTDSKVFSDLKNTALERIHFASAAPWWRLKTDLTLGVHMNAPDNPEALMRWILECVAYIRQELTRC